VSASSNLLTRRLAEHVDKMVDIYPMFQEFSLEVGRDASLGK